MTVLEALEKKPAEDHFEAEIDRLRQEVVFGFYEEKTPLFAQGYQGAGGCELAEPVTAAEVTGYVQQLVAEKERADRAEKELARLNAYLEHLFTTNGPIDRQQGPRIVDIAFTAFMQATKPNSEDGGPSDWFNDTYPNVRALVESVSMRASGTLVPIGVPS